MNPLHVDAAHAQPDGLIRPQSRSLVRFYTQDVEDRVETKKKGRPIFKTVEYVEVYTPGDLKNVFNQPATDVHRKRWPAEYQAFKSGNEVAMTGTPLEQWPQISSARAKELKALKIYSVEQLAELNETGVTAIGMGGRALVQQAKDYLAAAQDGALLNQLRHDNEELQAQNQNLKDQIQEQDEKMSDIIERLAELENDKAVSTSKKKTAKKKKA